MFVVVICVYLCGLYVLFVINQVIARFISTCLYGGVIKIFFNSSSIIIKWIKIYEKKKKYWKMYDNYVR